MPVGRLGRGRKWRTYIEKSPKRTAPPIRIGGPGNVAKVDQLICQRLIRGNMIEDTVNSQNPGGLYPIRNIKFF